MTEPQATSLDGSLRTRGLRGAVPCTASSHPWHTRAQHCKQGRAIQTVRSHSEALKTGRCDGFVEEGQQVRFLALTNTPERSCVTGSQFSLVISSPAGRQARAHAFVHAHICTYTCMPVNLWITTHSPPWVSPVVLEHSHHYRSHNIPTSTEKKDRKDVQRKVVLLILPPK